MPEKPTANVPPWLIPLACTRVDTTQNAERIGMEQMAACIKSQSAFSSQLSVSLGDTAYNKAFDAIIQPAQVQKDFERIIRWIGTPAQPPKPRQKALGRQLGDIQVKRIRHPIVKKWKNIAATEKMIA